jgi:RNA polymerase sigma factor (sigma-70 family)
MLSPAPNPAERARRIELALANRGLIGPVAARLANFGREVEDLWQDGWFGLWKAASEYDPARGVRFASYATLCITSAILDASYAAGLGRAVRLPKHVWAKARRWRHVAADLGDDAAAAQLGLSGRRARLVEAASRALAPSGTTADIAMASIVDPRPSPPDDAARRDDAARVRAAVARLPARHAEAIRLRFGLDDGRPLEFSGVAERLGITPKAAVERVRAGLGRLRVTLADPD